MNNSNAVELPLAALAEAPEEGLSNRYAFIPTMRVINVLQNEGWSIVKAAAKRSRTTNPNFTQHLIEFEHTELKSVSNDTNLRILLKNSHNGMSSFQFLLGLYRIVCSNGLVVSKGTAQSYSVRHVGYTDGKVAAALRAITAKAPMVSNQIESMQNTTADDAIAWHYAATVLHDLDIQVNQYNINQLTNENHRAADNVPNVWTLYNRVQERILKGKVYVNTDSIGGMRKLRAIKSIDRQIAVNQRLWDLAVNYTQVR
jgi:hypothetical protein